MIQLKKLKISNQGPENKLQKNQINVYLQSSCMCAHNMFTGNVSQTKRTMADASLVTLGFGVDHNFVYLNNMMFLFWLLLGQKSCGKQAHVRTDSSERPYTTKTCNKKMFSPI